MWMIKSKFDEHIRSKTDIAIANELLCKVLWHNICVVIQSMYELGIERPKVRNGRSVANLNTLIYVIVNVRVLAKAKSINKRLLPMN